ncbi:O-antigen ligase family protein [Paenibacillus sp. NPDC058071]|uniref:O-antigen ligase family protein n=1 Tax=Paenibacillus sp. NPDC058071 TaxID=3346326 RepID=UPI0036D9FB50
MSGQLLIVGLLVVFAAVFFTQLMTMLKLRIDAAYVAGFAICFDMFGYFYSQYVPINSFVLLLGAPLLPVCVALLQKPSKPYELLTEPVAWLWALFLLYSLTSFAWAPSLSNGLLKEQILLIRGVIPGIYIYILYKKYNRFSWTVVALFGLAYALMHLALGGYSSEYPGRLTMPGGNPIYDARIAFFTITVCLWGPRIPFVVRIGVMAAALLSGFYTQSRGPLVAFLAANAIVGAVLLIQKYRRGELAFLSRYAAPICFAVLAGLFGLYLYAGHDHQWLDKSRFTVLFDKSQLQADANYLGRMKLQEEAEARLLDNPFFGAGLGASSPPLTPDHPHNVIVEMASELGIVGLLLWSIALLYSIWKASRNRLLLVLLLQVLAYAQLSGDFGYNFEYLLIAFIAMALVSQTAGKKDERYEESAISDHRI